jgi:hypothetical protein
MVLAPGNLAAYWKATQSGHDSPTFWDTLPPQECWAAAIGVISTLV